MIQRLRFKKLLSFIDTEVELRPLNVLIGANGVGKSNLIEAVGLLQAAPTELSAAILRGGGIQQWLWLGDRDRPPVASVECRLVLPTEPLSYRLEFSEYAGGFVIVSEELANSVRYFTRSTLEVSFEHVSGPTGLARDESVLSFRLLADPTPITEVARRFQQIRIYKDFRTTGYGANARHGTASSAASDALWDGGDNLAEVMHELKTLGQQERVREYLRRFCERFADVKMRVIEGAAQLFLEEAGIAESLPAIRMSDGTLKFLCLLAVLLHPKKPPLICIEEPELGLHPDAMQIVAELLVEASETSQLIVTTHSDGLVDALSDRPESVLVCERDFDNGTQFKRLDKDGLHDWLEDYSLGQLWRKGEIGGTRW